MKAQLSEKVLTILEDTCIWEDRILHRKGTFSKIYRVENRVTGLEEVVKEISLEEDQLNRLTKTLLSHEVLNHQLIVKMNLIFDQKRAYNSMPLFHKDLRELISGGPVAEGYLLPILLDIVIAMQCFANHDLIHGNLKPSNILLKKNKKAYIVDYSLNILYENKQEQLNGLGIYSAPDLFLHKKQSTKQDVWSLGVILFEMVFGYPPWPNRNIRSYKSFAMKHSVAFPHDSTITENLKDFIKKCLNPEENQRISWKKMLEHPLIANHSFGSPTNPVKFDRRVINLLMRIQNEVNRKNKSIKRIVGDAQQEAFDFDNFSKMCSELNGYLDVEEISDLFKALRNNSSSNENWNTIKKILLEIDFRDASNFSSRFVKEMAEVTAQKGIESEEIRKRLSPNGSGKVQYEGFRDALLFLLPYTHESELNGIWTRMQRQFQQNIQCQSILNQLKVNLLKKNSMSQEEMIKEKMTKFKKSFGPFGNCTIRQVVEFFDINKDKKISFLEFREMVKSFFMHLADNQLKNMFDKIDRDHSGLISGDELKQFLKSQ